ncbi:Aryl-alcohol dehydrogenase (NADP(+)) [Acrodontium crateriforme]|uniref:Aryl-alcohol dehydrogenase (NADP(+)) n=1 Tax=Acrodontium crateriforme TaxID=150365 RepID=A0AAQ3MBJ9_9PEZI|nr:Aryl-alcohol dehydrogenase (NADP(+)) [Acrodontium crateriforme]
MMRAAGPKSLLGRHRLLAPSASVHVSPLCLGGMSIGDKHQSLFGEFSKDQAFELLDYFYDQGGNFIDTANMYQSGQSEEWIGEWMKKRKNRDEIVIATKYTMPYTAGYTQTSNCGGTGSKSMFVNFEASLKKLDTDYVDIYFVHHWDFSTGVAEVMQSLNTLVQQRKVLYLGISDAPAWVVVKCNAYARHHGLSPFSIYQGHWSAQIRDFEREIIPMCQDEGMALHPWGVLGRGYFESAKQPREGGRQTAFMNTGREGQVSAALELVANRHNVPLQSIALAYVMHKSPYVFPLVGGRKVSHMKSNIEALGILLSEEDMSDIDKGYDFDIGFPHNFIGIGAKMVSGPEDIMTKAMYGHFDHVKKPQPILAYQPSGNE